MDALEAHRTFDRLRSRGGRCSASVRNMRLRPHGVEPVDVRPDGPEQARFGHRLELTLSSEDLPPLRGQTARRRPWRSVARPPNWGLAEGPVHPAAFRERTVSSREPPPPRPCALFRNRCEPLREGRELGDLRGLVGAFCGGGWPPGEALKNSRMSQHDDSLCLPPRGAHAAHCGR